VHKQIANATNEYSQMKGSPWGG